ncbi:MAG: hypothetical protein M3Y46_10935 [Actinomycetota bacterium]|nr:hypothetical protein [Actinomycetota bacterium]
MNTALTTAGVVTGRPHRGATLIERMARRAGVALVTWSRSAGQRHTREQLAELYERRRVAERLREERFRNVAMSRLM